ncbi:MAG: hypothetical protein JO110_02705 [Acetobacteraceae bacterium]|nr:hypothetical protein [Acetobacteraceae bacterium]
MTGAAVLTITGRSDPYGRYASILNDTLRKLGAGVDAHTVQAGHELGPSDITIVQEWISRLPDQSRAGQNELPG